MMRALYTAATGMAAQQRNIDTTANNLANVNTTGYKKSKVHFQDLLYHNERTAGVPSSVSTQVPVGLHVGHGVKFIGTEKIHTQGNLENTGNDLDLSIDGHGFFPNPSAEWNCGLFPRRPFQHRRNGTIGHQ
jgi:flagellar basal-body rod protein FlgG